MWEWGIEKKDRHVYALCRLLILDMARCGGFLFYKPLYVNLACILLANNFLWGEMIVGKQQMDSDIYDDPVDI